MQLDLAQAQRQSAEQAANELLAREIMERERRRSRRVYFMGGAFAIRELARYPTVARRQIIAASLPAMLRDWSLWFWVLTIIAVGGLSFWSAETGLIHSPFPLPMVYAALFLAAQGGRMVWRRHVLARIRALTR